MIFRRLLTLSAVLLLAACARTPRGPVRVHLSSIETVKQFHQTWTAVSGASFTERLQNGSGSLTIDFRGRLGTALPKLKPGSIDPVLCATDIPSAYKYGNLPTPQNRLVQALVTTHGTVSTGDADSITTLVIEGGDWKIDAIRCGKPPAPPARSSSGSSR